MKINSELYTIGNLADYLDEPTSRIAYVISKHKLKPVTRIGIIRLFNKEQAEAIKQGLYLLRTGRNS